jgi:hypothetical protein
MGKLIKEWWKDGDRHWKVVFYISQVISVFLIVASFWVPPAGTIDPSVFAAIGELFAFPALLGFYNIVMSGKSATITKGNTRIDVNKEEKDGD